MDLIYTIEEIKDFLDNTDKDMREDARKDFISAVTNILMDRPIDVNDGDRGDGNREYLYDKTGVFNASLVLEEDGSVRWYFNPSEHSDLTLLVIPVRLPR